MKKLAGESNYHHWVILMKIILRREKLWQTIEPRNSILDTNEPHMADAICMYLSRLEKNRSATLKTLHRRKPPGKS